MENIAVLGSHSFSGNAYVAHLLKFTSCLSISRSKYLHRRLDARTRRTSNCLETRVVWNLNEDSSEVIDALNKHEISTVVNFAAQSMVGESWKFPQDWYETNVVALAKLINRIRSETSVKKFIQFSTPEVYGSTDGWVKESFAFSPSTPYAVSRAASDWHLKLMHERFGFPVVFTRTANVYGEFQPLYRIIPKTIFLGVLGKKLPLHGGGSSTRSFIHVSDVNNALDRIVLDGVAGETYHISTKRLISILDLIRVIAGKLDLKIEDFVEIAGERVGKDSSYQLDSEKIRNSLGWKDEIELEEGLDRTISWAMDDLKSLQELSTEYQHRR